VYYCTIFIIITIIKLFLTITSDLLETSANFVINTVTYSDVTKLCQSITNTTSLDKI